MLSNEEHRGTNSGWSLGWDRSQTQTGAQPLPLTLALSGQ